eukprot:5986971-Alexandrium_andersonii.AAC.1
MPGWLRWVRMRNFFVIAVISGATPERISRVDQALSPVKSSARSMASAPRRLFVVSARHSPE